LIENLNFHRFHPPQSRLEPSQEEFTLTPGIKCGTITRVTGLPGGEKSVNVQSLLLSQYQRVSDGHMDMPPMPMSRSSIAKSDKNDRPILLVEDEG